MKTRINTVTVWPTKEMTLELFRQCHRLAYYMEHMERVSENEVIWDDELVALYAPAHADFEYEALQNDWLQMSMELPEAFASQFEVPNTQGVLFTPEQGA